MLAVFTYLVTLPLLNCVEKCDQQELLKVLPQLVSDLEKGSMDTLATYRVEYHHITTPTATTGLEKVLLQKMCHHAAITLRRQVQEYLEENADDEAPRATQLYKLSPEQLDDLPTNNNVCESDFSNFSNLAAVAKSRNRNFTGKEIRNNCTLNKAVKTTVDRKSYKITKKLKIMEGVWVSEQNKHQVKRLESKQNKFKNHKSYVNKQLSLCKTWGGPFTSIDEMETVLQSHGDIETKVIRTELIYYKHTHKPDVIARPELFKLNKTTHEERLENLSTLLSDDYCEASYSPDHLQLPTNEDALRVLTSAAGNLHPPVEESEITVEVNEHCVTIWEQGWYIGYVLEVTETGISVDHLERVDGQKNDL